MSTYAVVNDEVVTNLILWDGISKWNSGEGVAVKIPDNFDVDLGYKYANGKFIPVNLFSEV
jgi:opacity protein-like surface antigen